MVVQRKRSMLAVSGALSGGLMVSAMACQLVGGIDSIDLVDDAGASIDGGNSPDGSVSVDGATVDAAFDASSDADAPVSDAAVDAGPWCKQQVPTPTFCDDFDEDPLGARWQISAQDRGTLTLDPLAVSAPNALRVLQTSASDCTKYERLAQSFPGTFHKVSAAFMVRTGPVPGDGGLDSLMSIAMIGVEAADGGGACATYMDLGATLGRLNFQHGLQDDIRPFTTYPRPGQWAAIEWEMTAADGGTRASVRIDGQTAMDNILVTDCTVESDVFFTIGFTCGFAGEEARFDNVRLTLE